MEKVSQVKGIFNLWRTNENRLNLMHVALVETEGAAVDPYCQGLTSKQNVSELDWKNQRRD